MKHQIATITVTLRKGQTTPTFWLVEQENPLPDTEGFGGHVRWRNHAGLFSDYGRPAGPMPKIWVAYLLKDNEPVPENYSRRHFAGHDGNPSPLVLRGKPMGEVCIKMDVHSATIRLNGHLPATPGEKAFMDEQVIPALRGFIAEHGGELYGGAVHRLAERFSSHIAELRREIDKLEQQSNECLARLRQD